ncbi:MAG TPA: PhzF family phenazine biosynthesis protein, partial [Methylomirabilota bacterium]|nr:PhzF family phenazine biosynthesis protein [Methylomirabilota bacterium]
LSSRRGGSATEGGDLARRYAVLDVFTDRALAGNPLAVVLDSEGLDDVAMQTIASEFGLPETVFVLPPPRPGISARVRIFTPTKELPFAGHPTVGTAVLLATDRLAGIDRETDAVVVLAEEVGNVRCGVMIVPGGTGHAVFDMPRLPEEKPVHGDIGLAASALGLDRSDIGFENYVMSAFSAGGPAFLFLPIANLDAMRRIKRDMSLWGPGFGDPSINVYAFTHECVHRDGDFHARMFGPELGIGEDPATGAAVAAFAGVVMRFDGASDGDRMLIVEQGYEMGRPSRIELEITVEKARLTGGRIGGSAVIVARGELYV